MTNKLMVCQLRKGDVIVGGSGKRYEVKEVTMLHQEVRLVTDKHEAVVPWFASVVVELGKDDI
jgi:hypothetical protein